MKSVDCGKCEHKKLVHAQGNFKFYGYHCKPYSGKWIAEIENCPKVESEGE